MVARKKASLVSPSRAVWLVCTGSKRHERPRTLVSKRTVTLVPATAPGAAEARWVVPAKPVAWQKAR